MAVTGRDDSIACHREGIKSVRIVRLLLAHGANANARTKTNRSTVLMHAAMSLYQESIRLEIMKQLLRYGADVNAKDRDGETVIMQRIRANELQLLLEHGAEVNAVDSGGESVLMHAAGLLAPKCTKMLLDRGADVNFHTDRGLTALWKAAVCGRDEIVKIIPQVPGINLSGPVVGAALEVAITYDNAEVVQEHLADHAVAQQLRNCNELRQTVFKVANELENKEIMEMLTKVCGANADLPATIETEDHDLSNERSELNRLVSDKTKCLLWKALAKARLGDIIKII